MVLIHPLGQQPPPSILSSGTPVHRTRAADAAADDDVALEEDAFPAELLLAADGLLFLVERDAFPADLLLATDGLLLFLVERRDAAGRGVVVTFFCFRAGDNRLFVFLGAPVVPGGEELSLLLVRCLLLRRCSGCGDAVACGGGESSGILFCPLFRSVAPITTM